MKEATLKVYQGKKKVLSLMKADFSLCDVWLLYAISLYGAPSTGLVGSQ